MDLIGNLASSSFWLVSYFVPFVFVLAIIVFFHELGHFLVARWCEVEVTAFSLGFGPELFGITDRHGTRWKVCAIPLGGFVKFLGDRNVVSLGDSSLEAHVQERRATFVGASVSRRLAIVAAGPIASFLLAVCIFSGEFMLFGRQVTLARVAEVRPNSPAATAGFLPGDIVIAVDNRKIDGFNELIRLVSVSPGQTLKITIDRQGSRSVLDVAPAISEVKDAFGNVTRIAQIGLGRSAAPDDTKIERLGPVRAIELALRQTWFIADQTLQYLFKVFVGRESADQLGGPIKIAQISGQAATFGFAALLELAGILSATVGLINLLPIPALDGGHILFYAIEAGRGRPVSQNFQKWGMRTGLVLVLALMIFTTVSDVVRLSAT
ncbi:RIP metalloprotease [Bradyrhizobium sp. BWC-3-1]|uniref:M50 family metallopeptidase n=1 Tax=Bradyrhizobium sp. BWC-3-1 TaxID=3080012 RepID=UPI00293E7EC5|nr:RIP metalloprotease [Bradyrhizobium sp. BWC-3-1]WOH56051.1 RIP metalloprotease [Bradyrhizobium sp. BWC-3-1]